MQPHGGSRRATRDSGDYVVAGTAGGAPTAPAWVHNVVANPAVKIEVDTRTFEAEATVVGDDDRERLWARHVAALPHFAAYPETARRVIPVIRITPEA